MTDLIKCKRCRINITSKKFSGCDDCSDEYEDDEGIHLCANCCILYSTLQSQLYDDFLENIAHLDIDYRVYYLDKRRRVYGILEKEKKYILNID